MSSDWNNPFQNLSNIDHVFIPLHILQEIFYLSTPKSLYILGMAWYGLQIHNTGFFFSDLYLQIDMAGVLW